MTFTWKSFRTRLMVGALVWITVAMTVCGVTLTRLYQQHVVEQFYDELNGHLTELESLVTVSPDGTLALSQRLSDPRFAAPNSGYYWQITSAKGAVLASPSLGSRRLSGADILSTRGDQTKRIIPGPTGDVRILGTEVRPLTGAGPLTIVIGMDERLLNAVLVHFNKTLFLSLAVITLGLLAAAVAQITFGLYPLRRLSDELKQIRGGQAAHLSDGLPDELSPLVLDLNALIDVNRDMLLRARAQAGNLAHALKTPLAIIADEARLLDEKGNAASATVLVTQSDRMRRQIDFHLARARAAASSTTPFARLEVKSAIAPILSAMNRLYQDKNLSFQLDCKPNLFLACDPQDLSEIMGNLIDNAAKWAKSEIGITVAEATGGQFIRLSVSDDGPGLPPESWEVVFKMGQRLDEEAPGSGLGLTIVRDLVGLYGGRVWLAGSDMGGLAASVELPVSH